MGEQYADALASRGFVHVPALGVTDHDISQVAELLDGLFERYDRLPRGMAHDLGGGPDEAKVPRVPEILDTSVLEPRLRRTAVFRAAHELARQLLGPRAYLTYDHAIYKAPGRSAPTSWHQDSGYDPQLTHGVAVWIPLQDTAEQDGCMHYVPGSHLLGPAEHRRRVGADGKEIRSLDVDPAEAVAVPCALGGAVAHDLHMVHGAGANHGSQLRRAWILNYSTSSPVRQSVRTVRRALSRRGRQVQASAAE